MTPFTSNTSSDDRLLADALGLERAKVSDLQGQVGSLTSSLAAAQAEGAQEAILLRDDGLLTEGSFTNLFVERGGKMLTPPLHLGLLPGVLRRSLIEEGRAEEAQGDRAGDAAGGARHFGADPFS